MPIPERTPYLTDLYRGQIPAKLTNEDLPAFKNFANAYFQTFSQRFAERSDDVFLPNCTLKNTLLYAIGVRGTKIVEAKAPTFFSLNIEDIIEKSRVLPQ